MAVFTHCTLVCAAMVSLFGHASGHGRMIEPAARNSMWRYGYKTPRNYNDMGLNCGGFTNQFERNRGQCGVCGDPYQGPGEHEAGGRYGRGVVARKYAQGSYINVTVELTSNHMGYFEFRICPVNNPRKKATQACMNRHLLNIVGHGRRYFIKRRDTSIFSELYVQLPPNLKCSQCVLQWKWVAGQSMGPDGYGGECLGCGNQEHFINCADIAIGSAPVQPLPMPAGGFTEPKPVAPPAAPAVAKPAYNSAPRPTGPVSPNGPAYQVSGLPGMDATMAKIIAQVYKMASKANRITAPKAAPRWNPPTPSVPKIVATTPHYITTTASWLNQPSWQKPANTWAQPRRPLQLPKSNPIPMPSSNNNYRPASNPIPMPSNNNNYRPASNPIRLPSNNNNYRPTSNQIPMPSSNNNYLPPSNAMPMLTGNNNYLPPTNPIQPPTPAPTMPKIYNQPSEWNQNMVTPAPTNYHENGEYSPGDYAGIEPGEYPEVGDTPSPGEQGHTNQYSQSGSNSYQKGFSDAITQLRQRLGLSGGNGNTAHSGKINTALSELSITMQEAQKPNMPAGVGTSSSMCPGGVPRECVAGGSFHGNSEFDSWCMMSCAANQCPANMCSCTCPGGGGGSWGAGSGCRAVDRTKGASMDTWCVANCKQNNCPSDLCVCGYST